MRFLPEFVYGAIDGSVTTFAVVASASGAELSAGIVLILGFANLIADGFSMSVGSYLSTKSEHEEYTKIRDKERESVRLMPDNKKAEIKEIYRKKGFEGETLDHIVEGITADPQRWLDTLMKDKWEMVRNNKAPFHTAMVTFVSFILIGLIPLISYVGAYLFELVESRLFLIACVLTGIAFVGIGYLKSSVNHTSRFRGIAETLALGAIAAALAYFVGDILEGWIL